MVAGLVSLSSKWVTIRCFLVVVLSFLLLNLAKEAAKKLMCGLVQWGATGLLGRKARERLSCRDMGESFVVGLVGPVFRKAMFDCIISALLVRCISLTFDCAGLMFRGRSLVTVMKGLVDRLFMLLVKAGAMLTRMVLLRLFRTGKVVRTGLALISERVVETGLRPGLESRSGLVFLSLKGTFRVGLLSGLGLGSFCTALGFVLGGFVAVGRLFGTVGWPVRVIARLWRNSWLFRCLNRMSSALILTRLVIILVGMLIVLMHYRNGCLSVLGGILSRRPLFRC